MINKKYLVLETYWYKNTYGDDIGDNFIKHYFNTIAEAEKFLLAHGGYEQFDINKISKEERAEKNIHYFTAGKLEKNKPYYHNTTKGNWELVDLEAREGIVLHN